MATRMGREQLRWFGIVHWMVAALLMGTAVFVHSTWFTPPRAFRNLMDEPLIGIPLISMAAFITLVATQRASRPG